MKIHVTTSVSNLWVTLGVLTTCVINSQLSNDYP